MSARPAQLRDVITVVLFATFEGLGVEWGSRAPMTGTLIDDLQARFGRSWVNEWDRAVPVFALPVCIVENPEFPGPVRQLKSRNGLIVLWDDAAMMAREIRCALHRYTMSPRDAITLAETTVITPKGDERALLLDHPHQFRTAVYPDLPGSSIAVKTTALRSIEQIITKTRRVGSPQEQQS